MVEIAIPQMGNDLFRKYMKSKYQKSLEAAGAKAIWIELEDTQQAVADAMKCDGLLLPGGADVNPKMYGENPVPECGKPNIIRDGTEPEILAAFLEADKPVLGICRGAQILNVALGGTLCQDIKASQKINHSDFLHRANVTHKVSIKEGTKLYSIVGQKSLLVNSIHHQTVKGLGQGLTVCAKSEDGFIEAIERPQNSFCLAVQWHPEHMAKKDKYQQRLFEAFVEACKNTH